MAGAELATHAPVGTVFGEGNIFETVGQQLGSFCTGSVCEDDVMGFEDLFGEGRGGDEDGRDGAKAEVHDRAVGVGELGYVTVRERAEQVEAADDGERARARGEAVGSPVGLPPIEEDEG